MFARVMLSTGGVLLCASALPERDTRIDQALIVGTVVYGEGVAPPQISSYNDAALAAQTLLTRGVPSRSITVLTERPSAALLESRGNPKLRDMPALATSVAPSTRAAIMAGMTRLARTAKRGSRVVIVMSGHGFQIPASGKDEADGLDGVYMPTDTGKGDGSTGTPPNVITDDEFAQAVEAIRRKGATVVLMLAFSHSGEFIDDLNLGSGDAAVGGMVSASATQQDRAYLLPHREYQAPQFAHAPMIGYPLLELAKQRGPMSIASLDAAASPWMRRHRGPPAIAFGRTDLPVM